MASEDQLVNCDIKIEIDVAEDPYPPSFGSQHQCTCDGTERSVKSATTSERDCWNPSAAAMKPEPDSQPAGGQGIKAEPDYDIGEDGDQGEESEQRMFSDSDVRTSDIEFSDSADEKAPVKTKKGNSRTRQLSSSDRTQHNSNTRRHVCDVCNKAFTRADHLKTHLKIHSGEKAFVCDVCSKAFIVAGNLKKHKRIHTGERPYKCPHCDVACKQSCSLQTHIRAVHAGDRPYVCQVCGAAFSETGNLERHKMIHTGKKPHECTVCGKRFAQSSHLKTHAVVHSGKKPHLCPHCPAEFTLSGNLKKHVQKFHQ